MTACPSVDKIIAKKENVTCDEAAMAEFIDDMTSQPKPVQRAALKVLAAGPWSQGISKDDIDEEIQQTWNQFAVQPPPTGMGF